jgi:hypothetical protein
MLNALSVAEVKKVIESAEELNSKRPISIEDIFLDEYDKFLDEYGPYLHDSQKLTAQIASLTENARAELKALAWLGRNQCMGRDHESFSDLLEEARQHADSYDPSYIAEMRPLALYLRNGLKKLGLSPTSKPKSDVAHSHAHRGH